jgi:hypothetical protein
MPANRDGLGGTARHIGPVGRGDRRRIAMRPIPGNVMGIRRMNIARTWWRPIHQGFATRWPVAIRWPVEALISRPECPESGSAAVPERVGDRRTGNRMRRGKAAAGRGARPGGCFAGGKHQRDDAERGDQQMVFSVHHGTHQSLVAEQHPRRTLGRAFGARKYIITN